MDLKSLLCFKTPQRNPQPEVRRELSFNHLLNLGELPKIDDLKFSELGQFSMSQASSTERIKDIKEHPDAALFRETFERNKRSIEDWSKTKTFSEFSFVPTKLNTETRKVFVKFLKAAMNMSAKDLSQQANKSLLQKLFGEEIKQHTLGALLSMVGKHIDQVRAGNTAAPLLQAAQSALKDFDPMPLKLLLLAAADGDFDKAHQLGLDLACHAVQDRDLQGLSALKKIGIDFNTPNRPQSPIHELVKLSNAQLQAKPFTDFAIENFDLNLPNHNGNTPLITAIHSGQELSVQRLIQNGANVKLKNNEGMTALHCAAQKSTPKCTLQLLDAGADPLAIDQNNENPLYLAARAEKTKCFSHMVKSIINELDNTANPRSKAEIESLIYARSKLSEESLLERAQRTNNTEVLNTIEPLMLRIQDNE